MVDELNLNSLMWLTGGAHLSGGLSSMLIDSWIPFCVVHNSSQEQPNLSSLHITARLGFLPSACAAAADLFL